MPVAPHRTPDVRGPVIYRARPAVFYVILICLILCLHLSSMICGLMLALFVPEHPHLLLAIVILFCWGTTGVGIALLLRPAFEVRTDGIVHRGYLRTRRLPWEEIRVIEVDRALMNLGGTVVVLHDGTRVRSAITNSRFALRRGESTVDHGPDLLQPARPTRAAIEAHRRWLRGELHG